MRGVRINSGPVEAENRLHSVPTDKWMDLVEQRRYFMARRLNYDCRCLVQFVRDAEQMWQPLGYEGLDDLVRRGYDLEPEEIRLAVRWLELNEPESAVGLPAVLQTCHERQQQAADRTTGEVLPRGNPTGANQHQ
jgi:hypothetical protein